MLLYCKKLVCFEVRDCSLAMRVLFYTRVRCTIVFAGIKFTILTAVFKIVQR